MAFTPAFSHFRMFSLVANILEAPSLRRITDKYPSRFDSTKQIDNEVTLIDVPAFTRALWRVFFAHMVKGVDQGGNVETAIVIA